MTRMGSFSQVLLFASLCVISGLFFSYVSFQDRTVGLYAPTIDAAFSRDLVLAKRLGTKGNWDAAHHLLKSQAKGDNPLAKLEYALLHLKGWGTKRDLESARLLLLQAVQYDFPDRGRAAYELGKVYRLSKGEDCARIAFEWFSKSIDWGYLKAHNELGKSYARGIGVTLDFDRAIDHYRRSIAIGSTSAVVPLFEIVLLQQQNGDADPARGVMLANQYLPILEVEAEDGNRIAARALGRIYARALFVSPDNDKAFKWFALASSNGDAVAMHDLALLAMETNSKTVRLSDALKFLKESADLGYPAAMTALGRTYLKESKVRDITKAVSFLEMGAKAGHAGAMAELAKLYFEGKIVQKNMKKAKDYARRGALQKHAGSRRILLKIEKQGTERMKNSVKSNKAGKV